MNLRRMFPRAVGRFFVSFCCILGFVPTLQGFSFVPLSLALLGLPFLGKIAGSGAKKGVKQTLANVDHVVGYVRIFLFFVTILVAVLLFLFVFRVFKRNIRKKKLNEIMTLLHRIQADLVLLADESYHFAGNQRSEVEVSVKEAFFLLKQRFSASFLRKRLGEHAFLRMESALDLILEEKMPKKNQLTLVNQWLKTINFLCR